MNMVEVDPKLFIKCRLCLEDSGTYQIVPTVQAQISYCFDINVEPFDGLPQLICKKCQSILSDYSKTKKSYKEKQDRLKIRVQNIPKEVIIERTEPSVKRENIDPVDKYETKSSRKRKVSVASSANESESNHDSVNQLVNSMSKVECNKQDWKNKYQKIFSCRLCSSHCYSMKSASHHSSNHRILKSKHGDVFNKYCVVQLPKVDSKPNITGSIDLVVYSKNKIIAKGNPDYYIAYKYTRKKDINNPDYEDMPDESLNAVENSDSSLRSNDVVVRRRRKRRRICSRSSNETVVLENKSDKSSRNSEENECINIDDTDSDDEKTEINREKRKLNKKSVNVIKHSVVAKLINTTLNKFLKKHEQPDKPSLEQLNRKITSIGRQIINKRGFNCTRVMKYMDHLNLNIIWLSRSPLNVTSNSNYLKIIPRVRYPNEKNINDFEGYKKKYDVLEIPIRTTEASVEEESNIVETSGVQEIPESQGIFSETVDIVSSSANETSRTSFAPELESAMLYCSVIAPNTKKILNANPAANPRQLKKFTIGPKSFQDRARSRMLTLEVNPLELSSEVTSEDENNIQMPIITFTTSLAVPQVDITPVYQETLNNNSTENGNPENSNNEKPKPTGPRIKVKSVTELMSQETLNRMNEPAAVLTPNQQITPNGPELDVFRSSQNNVPSISEDYVILHTVELPNTKTSSPFKYFRMLLQVHNLTLLDTDAFLTAEFHTLIRFKVLYKQESKDQPVVLCLSLFCSNNVFCLKIKDRNEDNINMTKISANWQWEILKIYTGEVVTKLLNNARKIGPEVHNHTNSFLCLLKSITFIQR